MDAAAAVLRGQKEEEEVAVIYPVMFQLDHTRFKMVKEKGAT